jgi:ABC-type dipeptide/oligopeptide/nickel transport system permease subunit
VKIPSAILAILFCLALAAPALCGSRLLHDPDEIFSTDSPPPESPGQKHWLGTDDRGRDLTARLICAIRNSLLFSATAVSLIFILGYSVATITFLSGRGDRIASGVILVFKSLPNLGVMLLVGLFSPPGFWSLTGAWVLLGWATVAQLARAEMLGLAQQDFVLAARALGANKWQIFFRHVLPGSLGPVFIYGPYFLSTAVTALAALDFLGIGLPIPASTFGEILREGRENFNHPTLVAAPLVILTALLWALRQTSDYFGRKLTPAPNYLLGIDRKPSGRIKDISAEMALSCTPRAI